MKKNIIFLAVAVALSGPSLASVLGTGGSSEVTQIANNVQLMNQYAQQVEQYVRQGLQLEAQMKNLIQNPASMLGKDVGGIINGVGRLYSAGNSIGGNLATIDRNFANTFKSPTAKNLADSFTRWHSTNTSTLEAAMKSAGLVFDSQQSEADNLQRLFDKSQGARGNLEVMQVANEINSMNVQQLQKLSQLIAAQNLAQNTYLASQTAKDEAQNKETDGMKKAFFAVPWEITPAEIDTAPRRKWNMYSK